MKKPFPAVARMICVLIMTMGTVVAEPIAKTELEEITTSHKRWWGTDLELRLDELPKDGMVQKNRIPWSGHIYPDRAGGCGHVLRKYDYAFYPGRSPAASFERYDISIHQTGTTSTRRGLFGRSYTTQSYGTPHWAGHCNGWTAAAIRHAEPGENNVTRNGVVFTPADIKGLMAELYVYGDIELLGGAYGYAVNAATFHVTLANWIGKGKHPIGMDNSLGREIWNYPVYSYKSNSAKRGNRQVEVKTNIGFVNSTDREYDVAPKRYKFLYFHYWLDLDQDGKIVGGGYYRDSNQIDLLWAPLQPSKGGTEGNKEGNPYLDPKVVLSLWRDSVPEQYRKDWYNVNPWPEDAIIDPDEEDKESAVADADGPRLPPAAAETSAASAAADAAEGNNVTERAAENSAAP